MPLSVPSQTCRGSFVKPVIETKRCVAGIIKVQRVGHMGVGHAQAHRHQPYCADSKLQIHKRIQLDRLYQKVIDDLDELVGAVGLKAA